MPKPDYIESFNRSDNPVFVFGTLLNQGRFAEENFDIDALRNRIRSTIFQSRCAPRR